MTMVIRMAVKHQNLMEALISESLRLDQGPQQVAEHQKCQEADEPVHEVHDSLPMRLTAATNPTVATNNVSTMPR
jgi:hypothetical protein